MSAPAEDGTETTLQHGRVTLRLVRIRNGTGLPLLLLHALRGSAADWGDGPRPWPGPVHALDFAGHGGSSWLRGGAYAEELLAGDADAALAQIGPCVLVGAGVGAYAALLLAGGRPETVRAAVLTDGSGLEGIGPQPDYARHAYDLATEWSDAGHGAAAGHGSDPRLVACERHVRPPEYAAEFATAATRLVLVEDGTARPPWWEAAGRAAASETAPSLERALERLASDLG